MTSALSFHSSLIGSSATTLLPGLGKLIPSAPTVSVS